MDYNKNSFSRGFKIPLDISGLQIASFIVLSKTICKDFEWPVTKVKSFTLERNLLHHHLPECSSQMY